MLKYIAIYAVISYTENMFNSVSFPEITYMHILSEQVDKNDFFNHQHETYEILYVVKGEGTFLIEDSAYEFSGNTLFMIPPGKYHVLKIPPQSNYERIVLNFSPQCVPPFIRHKKYIFKNTPADIFSLFFKFDRYADSFSQKPLYTLLTSLLSEALILLEHFENHTVLPENNIPAIVKNAVNFINDHLDEPLSVEIIADSLYVSKTHLCHIFSKTMNIGIMRYVRMKKMFQARKYIAEGVSVQNAAEALGYDCYTTFLRNYKREFHVNPSEK